MDIKIWTGCEKAYKLIRKNRGGNTMEAVLERKPNNINNTDKPFKTLNKFNKKSVIEMEKFFGIDNIEPIKLTPSDTLDKDEKGDCFADWYEEELAEKYEKYNR
ncbi:hypothetical protein ACXAT3_002694 [Clostridium sporogenes]